jgi:hypothetical protein
MPEIQCTYVLPDGSRHEFIRADAAAFRFEDDGTVHADTSKGAAWKPDYEARAGQAAGKDLIWHIEQFEDDGATNLVSNRHETSRI